MLTLHFYSSLLATTQYSITQYTSKDGLPQNSIRSIVQDKTGLIWFGTESGIVRFDGLRFKKIKAPLGKTVVTKLQIDDQDRLWIKWFDFPSDIYDIKNNTWTELKIISNKNNEQVTGFVNLNSKYWITGSQVPISYYDLNNNLIELKHPVNNFIKNLNGSVYDYYQKDNSLFVSAYNGLFKINIDSENFDYFKFESSNEKVIKFIKSQDNLLLCSNMGLYELKGNTFDYKVLYQDDIKVYGCYQSNNKIYIDTHSSNLLEIDTNNYTIKTVNIEHSMSKDLLAISAIDERLILLYSNELLIIDKGVTKSISLKQFNQFKYFPSTLLVTEKHSIWFGTDTSGLFKISKNGVKFKTIKSPLNNSSLFRKAVQKDNELWLGSDNGGVARWNRLNNRWKHYPFIESNLPRYKNQVRAITLDSQQQIWVGSRSGKLYKYQPIEDDFKLVNTLGKNQINTMLSFRDFLFIGSNKELYIYNTNSNTYKVINIRGFHVKAQYLTHDGNLLIGTHYGGVSLFSIEGKELNFWGNDVLSSRNVFSIYEDKYGYIWVGTWGGGLNRLNPKTNEVQIFNEDNGLSDNTIFGILPGQKGELWLSSYNGLMQLKGCITEKWPCEPKIRYYHENDGLQGNEFDAESFALLETGELYFAGFNGFNVFNPQDFPINTTPPEMVFTDTLLDHNQYLMHSNTISVNHDFTQLSLEFAALDYNKPKANKYQYREDKNTQWINLEIPKLEFLSLSSGTHRYEIRGSNNDGVWTKNPLSIKIIVKPPFYFSTLAYIIYALLLIVSFMTWIYYRERKLQAQSLQLKQQVKDRTLELETAYNQQNMLYSSISHNIRTPLTNLLLPIEELREGKKLKKEWIDTLFRQSSELKHYIDDLINLAQLESEENLQWGAHEIEPYLTSLQQDFKLLAESKDINIKLNLKTHQHMAVRSYRRSLNIIMNNLVENAIKQTPNGGKIIIHSKKEDNNVIISVEDSGNGISKQELKNIFDFGSTNKKSLGWLDSKGIGLNISLKIAKALEGDLTAKNAKVKGAIFELTLPMADSNHIKISDNTHIVKQADSNLKSPIRSTKENKSLILLVDDNKDILRILSEILNGFYAIITAENGKQALEVMANEQPDLVISDVMMPEMNGFEFLKSVRKNLQTELIPVIMLTAMEEQMAKLQSLKYKADATLSKPFNKQELLLTTENILYKNQLMFQKAQFEYESFQFHNNKKIQNIENIHQKVMKILETEYKNPQLNVQVLAKLLHSTESTLKRNLSKHTSVSPLAIIHNFRINKSKAMIKAGVKITTVAFDCGYSSSQVFAKTFKKYTKKTPSQYKKSLID
ncbi:MAG: response regulator [Marinicellaceae bacterium]